MSISSPASPGPRASAGSFHKDIHSDLKADYILANPPFNISDWGGERLNEKADVVISWCICVLNLSLTEDQQKAIALDFGMQDKQIQLCVRLAMLYYLLRRLGLDFKEHERDAREQHIILADPETVFSALEKAQYR